MRRRNVHTRRKNNTTLLILLLTFFLFDNILLSFSVYIYDRMDELLLSRRLRVECTWSFADVGHMESGDEIYDWRDTEQMKRYLELGKEAVAAEYEDLMEYLEERGGVISCIRRTQGLGTHEFYSYKDGQEICFSTKECDYEAIKDYILTEGCGEPGAGEVILPKYYGPGGGRDTGSYLVSTEELDLVEYDAEELVGKTITGSTYGQEVALKVIGVYDNYALGLDNALCFGEETVIAFGDTASLRNSGAGSGTGDGETDSAGADSAETNAAEAGSTETDVTGTDGAKTDATGTENAGTDNAGTEIAVTDNTGTETVVSESDEDTEEDPWNIVDDIEYYITFETRADLLAAVNYINYNLEYLYGYKMGVLFEVEPMFITAMAMIGNVVLAFLMIDLFVNIVYTEETIAWLRRREYGLMKAVGYRTVDVALFHIKDTAKSTLAGLAVTFAVGAVVFTTINLIMEPYLNLTFETFRVRMLPGVMAVTLLVGIGSTVVGGGIGLRHVMKLRVAEALKVEE
ncbi:MAG: hypothetical protein LUE29_09420 [Lachnospiraceae bacterium]|nr:hypothetical protein [Lachnospiraceae bacterium]